MGIKGLYPFLKNAAPNCKKPRKIQNLDAGPVAVDANFFMYRSYIFNGSDVSRLVGGLMKIVNFLLKNKQQPILVFDGLGHVAEKAKAGKLRENGRQQASKKLKLVDETFKRHTEAISQGLDPIAAKDEDPKFLKKVIANGSYKDKMKELENSSKKIDPSVISNVIDALEHNQVTCIRAESEADFVLAHLYLSGQVNYVYSSDGDLFAFGVGKLVRGLEDYIDNPDEKFLDVYHLKKILSGLDMTMEEFIIFARVLQNGLHTDCSRQGWPSQVLQGRQRV